jgi:hypothetical protein
MVRAAQKQFGLSTKRIVDHVLQSKELNRQEHLYLASALLGGERLNDEERRQVNRIFDQVQNGQIRIVDG